MQKQLETDEFRVPKLSRHRQHSPLERIIQPLASLKLTVVLMAMAIFIILAGTVGQRFMSVWEAINYYFRVDMTTWETFTNSLFAWIDLKIFFPRKWDVSGGFYFPTGWLIGFVMAINLAAAHSVRFRLQAKGARMWTGIAVTVAGALLTWLVIDSGLYEGVSNAQTIIQWETLWVLMKVALTGLWAALIYALFKIDSRRHYERAALVLLGGGLGVLLGWLLLSGAALDPSSMRILWQLIKATIAGCVLLVGCILLFHKRAGIVLLHGGIALMMTSELLTGTMAREGMMPIIEGETTNFTYDENEIELAIIDTSHPDEEAMTVVPQHILLSGERIEHDDLPFAIEVGEYFKNSEIKFAGDDPHAEDDHLYVAGLSDRGAGRFYKVKRLEPSTGVNSSINVSTLAVCLLPKEGKSAAAEGTAKDEKSAWGKYLLSTYFDLAGMRAKQGQGMCEKVKIGDKTYDVALRYRREYKPYSITLLDVRGDMYVGTSTPKNYSSDIRMVDADRGISRESHIWMNNPMRYGDEAFYQSQFDMLRDGTDRGFTGLQVVTNNHGWMIPYVSCMIVAVGMLAHFGIVLVRFLRRRSSAPTVAAWGSMAAAAAGGFDVTWLATVLLGPATKASVNYAKRRADRRIPDAASGSTLGRALSYLVFPLAVVLAAGLYVASKARPVVVPEKTADIAAFGNLPVVSGGRAMPFDTLARSKLRIVSDRDYFEPPMDEATLKIRWPKIRQKILSRWKNLTKEQVDSCEGDLESLIDLIVAEQRALRDDGEEFSDEEAEQLDHWAREYVLEITRHKQPAIKWLLDVITRPDLADEYRVFRIQNLEVLALLGLEPRDGFRYAYAEFSDAWEEAQQEAEKARKEADGELSVFQRKLIELDSRLRSYIVLRTAFRAPMLPELPDVAQLMKNPTPKMREQMRRFSVVFKEELARQQQLLNFDPPLAVPVPEGFGDDLPDDGLLPKHASWETYSQAWLSAYLRARLLGKSANKATIAIESIFVAYSRANAAEFNTAVSDYASLLAKNPPEDTDLEKAGYEAWFNQFEPFYLCTILYLLAFFLAGLAWLGWSGPLNRAAFLLILLTFAIHTFAMIARIYISGRPPVTNLYNSALFIGWGCVLLAIVLETVYRIGIGNVVGGVCGFATLLIAQLLTTEVASFRGDNIGVMQAVLDTQFWLATHVTIITTGYATTFLAGVMGLVYVIGGIATPLLHADARKELARMIYGTVCFGVFCSFIGTVLGGLWADNSWGRFWGWDTKENGALIIVLWNTIVLHARWDGMVRDRGLAVLAIIGNVATAWSWFGVNELGVGLHSYGFTEGAARILLIFVATQLACVALGCLPTRLWWSHLAEQKQGPARV